jgi:hypothetical protein
MCIISGGMRSDGNDATNSDNFFSTAPKKASQSAAYIPTRLMFILQVIVTLRVDVPDGTPTLSQSGFSPILVGNVPQTIAPPNSAAALYRRF